jgi:hypothetical protein
MHYDYGDQKTQNTQRRQPQDVLESDGQPGAAEAIGGLEREAGSEISDCSPGTLARQSAEAIARVRDALGQLREFLTTRSHGSEFRSTLDTQADHQ